MNTTQKKMSTDHRRCYACLNHYKEDLVPLDTKDRDKITYSEKLKTLIGQDLIKRNRMEICPECKTKLRISYQFQVSVLSCQVVLKLQKKRGLKIRLPQRVGVKNKVRIVKKDSSEVKRRKEIVLPRNSIDLASDMTQPSEIAPQQDANDVSGDSGADGHNSSFNLDDFLVIKDRVKPDKNKPKAGKDEPVYCNVCCKKFDEAADLEKHKTNEHKQWVHVCPHCPQRYGHSFELKAHLALRHKGHTGKRICEICGRKNSDLSHHLRHMRSHLMPPGQRSVPSPYLCTVCGKSFAYSNGRALHMRRHMGIKNYKCAVCNRTFAQRQHLVIHMRSHTGEKPYICEFCGQAFSIKACMNSHIRRKHGNDDKRGDDETRESENVQSKESEASKTRSAPTFYSDQFEEFQRMLT